MSWRTDWKAISDQTEGLLDAARFYVESLGPRSTDVYSVARKQLIPHSKRIFDTIAKYEETYARSLPPVAVECLNAFTREFGKFFSGIHPQDDLASIQVIITSLTSFRSEFNYRLSDATATGKRLSERAFIHLQRSIVADLQVREKWTEAHKKGEIECEKLGGAHLLLHGIWAFKVGAEGERTDLVLGEPLQDIAMVERSAETLVLPSGSLSQKRHARNR